MKKGILTLFSFMLLISSSFAQGFDPANLRADLGLNYATEISTAGLTLTGVYEIDETWEGAFAFTHFFEKDYVKWSVVDIDGHYAFHEISPQLNVHGLAGLSVTSVTVDMPASTMDTPFGPMTVPGISTSDSNIGLNLGMGANYALTEILNVAPELRYTITDGGYLRIGATLQYMF